MPFQLYLPKFFRSIEIWLIAMGNGGNPPFAEELTLHQVSLKMIVFVFTILYPSCA